MPSGFAHQYLDRLTGDVRDETLYWDSAIRFLYSTLRERAPIVFHAATSRHMSKVLAFLNYDCFITQRLGQADRFLEICGIDKQECVERPEALDTLAKIFERQIRYWECRPLPVEAGGVVSPADSRMVCGSLAPSALFFLKGKFFELDELLGERSELCARFTDGDWAIFRLTPEKYHYSHCPVSGRVTDYYEVDGKSHSCNPTAMVEIATPLSKNRRAVTVVDTDVPDGSQVGLVVMIEVGALMIGGIVQCYSDHRYELPRPMRKGLFLSKGAPKSRYRPGGSTDVLLFEKGRIEFCEDLLHGQRRSDVRSRYSLGFGHSCVETEVRVRSLIATAMNRKTP